MKKNLEVVLLISIFCLTIVACSKNKSVSNYQYSESSQVMEIMESETTTEQEMMNKDDIQAIENTENEKDDNQIEIVDNIIKFGKYQQGLTAGSSLIEQPIEWIVLEKKDNRVLLLSKYILDLKCYNDLFDPEISYENSSLRKWLNNDFFNEAFSDEDKERIQPMALLNNANEKYNVSNTNTTIDKVFILSIDDIVKYFGEGAKTENGYEFDQNVATSGTEYAQVKTNDAYDYDAPNLQLYVYNNDEDKKEEYEWANGNSPYWLRSVVGELGNVAAIDYNSFFDMSGIMQNMPYLGVRPAICINIE